MKPECILLPQKQKIDLVPFRKWFKDRWMWTPCEQTLGGLKDWIEKENRK